jgi:hypothetical protein
MFLIHQIKRFVITLAAMGSLLFVIQADGKDVAIGKHILTADEQIKGTSEVHSEIQIFK